VAASRQDQSKINIGHEEHEEVPRRTRRKDQESGVSGIERWFFSPNPRRARVFSFFVRMLGSSSWLFLRVLRVLRGSSFHLENQASDYRLRSTSPGRNCQVRVM
jgi:hypothetical protein